MDEITSQVGECGRTLVCQTGGQGAARKKDVFTRPVGENAGILVSYIRCQMCCFLLPSLTGNYGNYSRRWADCSYLKGFLPVSWLLRTQINRLPPVKKVHGS